MGFMAGDGQPALICAACRAAMPLDGAVIVDVTRRSLTCPECGTVATWSVDEGRVIDLPRSSTDQADDDTEAPGPVRRREG